MSEYCGSHWLSVCERSESDPRPVCVNFICVCFLQDRDLDCKLKQVREAGGTLPEIQVIDWLVQLLLGLQYVHER